MPIKDIILREILDSRGNPTIEAEVFSEKNTARAAAPSGASVGTYEVRAFPEGGIQGAIERFEEEYFSLLQESKADYHEVDKILADSDPGFTSLGGNAVIAISLAIAKLQAKDSNLELYQLLGKKLALPYPIGNVIGGGVHAGKGSPEIQEFLCIPIGAKNFKEAVLANLAVHKKALEKIYKIKPEFTRGRNDEGGWAPQIKNEQALGILSESCSEVFDEIGFEIRPGLDMAASEFFDKDYVYKTGKKSQEEQINYVSELVDKYNLYYVEDPLEENDFEGFAKLTEQLGKKCLIVGDDLITTNPERLQKAIEKKACNSLIIKPNQIGTLTDTEKVINIANENAYSLVVSHRSGETTDTSIAHLAVGFSAPIIKTGITGGERMAKLNELIRIEEKNADKASMAKLPLK